MKVLKTLQKTTLLISLNTNTNINIPLAFITDGLKFYLKGGFSVADIATRESLETGFFDDYTRAHLSESANKIQSVYKAQTIIN